MGSRPTAAGISGIGGSSGSGADDTAGSAAISGFDHGREGGRRRRDDGFGILRRPDHGLGVLGCPEHRLGILRCRVDGLLGRVGCPFLGLRLVSVRLVGPRLVGVRLVGPRPVDAFAAGGGDIGLRFGIREDRRHDQPFAEDRVVEVHRVLHRSEGRLICSRSCRGDRRCWGDHGLGCDGRCRGDHGWGNSCTLGNDGWFRSSRRMESGGGFSGRGRRAGGHGLGVQVDRGGLHRADDQRQLQQITGPGRIVQRQLHRPRAEGGLVPGARAGARGELGIGGSIEDRQRAA